MKYKIALTELTIAAVAIVGESSQPNAGPVPAGLPEPALTNSPPGKTDSHAYCSTVRNLGIPMPQIWYRLAAAAALTVPVGVAVAQEPAKDPEPLAVGTMAPDVALPGATRYGVLERPVHLSDFRGKTVVLAFFFKARTKG